MLQIYLAQKKHRSRLNSSIKKTLSITPKISRNCSKANRIRGSSLNLAKTGKICSILSEELENVAKHLTFIIIKEGLISHDLKSLNAEQKIIESNQAKINSTVKRLGLIRTMLNSLYSYDREVAKSEKLGPYLMNQISELPELIEDLKFAIAKDQELIDQNKTLFDILKELLPQNTIGLFGSGDSNQ